MLPTVYLRYIDRDRNQDKFWSGTVRADGTLMTRWGRYGTHGNSKDYPHSSTSAAIANLNERVSEKLSKGYWNACNERPRARPQPYDPGIHNGIPSNSSSTQVGESQPERDAAGVPSHARDHRTLNLPENDWVYFFRWGLPSQDASNSKSEVEVRSRLSGIAPPTAMAPTVERIPSRVALADAEQLLSQISTISVESSHVWAIGYSSELEVLRVDFYPNRSQYLYFDVPRSVFAEFLEADSKGAFLNAEIKGRYRYERVD